jgi:hypothetical protein
MITLHQLIAAGPKHRHWVSLVWNTVLVCLGAMGCGSRAIRSVPSAWPLVSVVVPAGGEGDRVEALVDGKLHSMGWYCVAEPAPRQFEVMLADGQLRSIGAVGFVPGNLGPDGPGPVLVRIQHGHGVASRGESFVSEVSGRSGQLHLVQLPQPTTGDHVVLVFLQRSAYNTASCLGEITLYENGSMPADPDVAVATAESIGGARLPTLLAPTRDHRVEETASEINRGETGPTHPEPGVEAPSTGEGPAP